jgi:hypothetical protein
MNLEHDPIPSGRIMSWRRLHGAMTFLQILIAL